MEALCFVNTKRLDRRFLTLVRFCPPTDKIFSQYSGRQFATKLFLGYRLQIQ